MQTAATRSLLIAEPGECLTLPQIARMLGVNRATVHRWVQAGRLPAQSLRGTWFVRRADVEAMNADTAVHSTT